MAAWLLPYLPDSLVGGDGSVAETRQHKIAWRSAFWPTPRHRWNQGLISNEKSFVMRWMRTKDSCCLQ